MITQTLSLSQEEGCNMDDDGPLNMLAGTDPYKFHLNEM